MGKIMLMTGGARSGKSTYALTCASAYEERRIFIATAVAFDDELKERIRKHREERAGMFTTIEEPYDLCGVIKSLDVSCTVALVDCLTVWLGNLFYKHQDNDAAITTSIEELFDAVTHPRADLIFVTNEVGMGIVPENALARRFRDMQGYVNRRIAQIAQQVFLCCCGIPIKIK